MTSALDRAARLEAEANAGFNDVARREAERLFQIALRADDLRERAKAIEKAAESVSKDYNRRLLVWTADDLRREALLLEEHA